MFQVTSIWNYSLGETTAPPSHLLQQQSWYLFCTTPGRLLKCIRCWRPRLRVAGLQHSWWQIPFSLLGGGSHWRNRGAEIVVSFKRHLVAPSPACWWFIYEVIHLWWHIKWLLVKCMLMSVWSPTGFLGWDTEGCQILYPLWDIGGDG